MFTPKQGFTGRDEFTYQIEGSIPELLVLAITAPDLSTSQMALNSASWSFNATDTSPSAFNFSGNLNEASPAIIDALTRGVTLPSVTVLTRRTVSSTAREVITKETLRWTLYDVKFSSFFNTTSRDGQVPAEQYSAEFKRIELNVVAEPDVIGSRYQAGFDFADNSSFAANQFAKLATKYPLTVNDINDLQSKRNLMKVSSLGGFEIDGFSGGVSNSADLSSSGRTAIETVGVTLPATAESDQVIAELLSRGLTDQSLGDVTLSRAFSRIPL